MKEYDYDGVRTARKKNGHKHDCACHICDNMRNKAKRGGYSSDRREKIARRVGLAKPNGHRMSCSCLICRNMERKTHKVYRKTPATRRRRHRARTPQ